MKIHIPAFEPMAKCNEHLRRGAIDIDLGDDVVKVVRCKDCKHFCLDLSGRENHLCMRKEVGFVVRRKADDFCSYGERKTDG